MARYKDIAGSSNGRTAPSGGVYPGSSPGPAASDRRGAQCPATVVGGHYSFLKGDAVAKLRKVVARMQGNRFASETPNQKPIRFIKSPCG